MDTDVDNVWREIHADSDQFQRATGFSRCLGGEFEGVVLSPECVPPQSPLLPPTYDLWLGPHSILLRPQYKMTRHYRQHRIPVALPCVQIPFQDIRLMRFSQDPDGSMDKVGSLLAIEMVNGHVFLLATLINNGLWGRRLVRAFREVLQQQSRTGARPFLSWRWLEELQWPDFREKTEYTVSRDSNQSFSAPAAEELQRLESLYDSLIQGLRDRFPGELTTEGLQYPSFPSDWRFPRSSSLARLDTPLWFLVLEAWVKRAASPEESLRVAQSHAESTRLFSYGEGQRIRTNVRKRSGGTPTVFDDTPFIPTRLPSVISESEVRSETASRMGGKVSLPPPSTPVCQSPPQTPLRTERGGDSERETLDPISPTRVPDTSKFNPSSPPRLSDLESSDKPNREEDQRWILDALDAAADCTDLLRELGEEIEAERRNPSTESTAHEKWTLRESDLASALGEEKGEKEGGEGVFTERDATARVLCGEEREEEAQGEKELMTREAKTSMQTPSTNAEGTLSPPPAPTASPASISTRAVTMISAWGSAVADFSARSFSAAPGLAKDLFFSTDNSRSASTVTPQNPPPASASTPPAPPAPAVPLEISNSNSSAHSGNQKRSSRKFNPVPTPVAPRQPPPDDSLDGDIGGLPPSGELSLEVGMQPSVNPQPPPMVAAAADHRAEARTLPHSTGRTVASSPRLPPRGCDSLSPSHSSTISVSVASSSTMIEFSPAPPSSGSFKTVRSLLTLREKTAEGAEEEQDELDAGPRQTVLTSRGMRPSTPSASRGKGGPPQSACVGMPRRVRGDSLSPLEAEEEMSVPTEEPNRMIPPTFLVPSQFAQQQQHGDGEERQSPVRAAQQVFSHEDLRTRILDFALSVPARPVRLRVYNLSREWGWVNRLKGLRQHLLEGGGAYHVSVEVDGVEWHYGAEKDGEFASCGITAWDPDELDFYGAVDHVVELGETRVPRWRIVKILDRMYDNDGFHTHGYLLYSRNCVHFVDTFLSRLAEADTGVQRMPTRYLRAHELARAVHNWLSGGKLDRLPEVTPKDPLAVQAALPRHTLDRCKLYDPRPKGAVLRLRGEEFFFPDQLVPCLSASALFHK